MRIVFLGLPLAALLLSNDGHQIDFAVLSRDRWPGERRLARRLGPTRVHSRPELTLGEVEARMRASPPDLLVSWFWTTKVPASLVGTTRLGGIGVHPSLLPRHRGPDPYFAAIDQGDEVTGVTVHRIDDEYDTGAILASREVTVDASWNAWQLARRLDRPSLVLLRETVRRFAAGETVPEKRQDDEAATWAPEPSTEECALRWSWPTARLLRRMHALAPSPGAFTEIGDSLVTVLAARPATSFPKALAPGEAAVVGRTAVVRTGDGAIELVRGEVDGVRLDAEALARLVALSRDLVIG